MNFPQIFKRLFFPKRQAEDRPEPDKHTFTQSTDPATSTQEVLEHAVASQEEGSAQAAEPLKEGRVSVKRAAEKNDAAGKGGKPAGKGSKAAS